MGKMQVPVVVVALIVFVVKVHGEEATTLSVY
jgi:hypothetical protein